jgi:nucleoside-diphosphate-sugar epimerase
MNILITGAAGNLGSLLARYVLDHEKDLKLILMKHRKNIANDISNNHQVTVRQADLAKPETLDKCLEGSDVIVHFAGVLFKAKPEKFLYQTNIQYFENLVQIATEKRIKKVILISFPHVEGATPKTL